MAVYYVRTNGNNSNSGTVNSAGGAWATIAYACANATTNGDIIYIVSGTHTVSTQCELAVGVSISGDGYTNSIIESTHTGDFSTFLNLESVQGTNGNQSISHVTLDGKYVSEANFKTWVGIWITGRNNVSIHDCRIRNWYNRGVIYNGINATDPTTEPSFHATGNTFYNNIVTNSATNTGSYGAGCINIGCQSGMTIYNNTITQTGRAQFKNGWPIKYWNNGWLKDCRIYDNVLTKEPYSGNYPGDSGDFDFAIELFNIRGLVISGNTIQGSIDLNYNYKGIYDYSAWIHHNTINHAVLGTSQESGIILEFATESALIEHNTFNNLSHAILFNARTPANNGGYPQTPAPTGGYSHLTNNIIRNNLFTNIYSTYANGSGKCCGGVGIQVYVEFDDNDPYIRNLSIYNNTFVAKSGQEPSICLDFASFTDNAADVDGIYVRNNIFQGFADNWLLGSNPTHANNVIVTHNDAYLNGSNSPTWPGGNPTNYTANNNISVNPLFVGGGDYTLQNVSTLIDAGVDVGIAYNGSAPDIGYAEYLSNTNPIANAGPDQTITLPTSSVTMAGSGSDSDGTISSQVWTKISGPATYTITDANSYTTTITGLVAGTYVFRLTVTDNDSGTDTDDVQITVNAAQSNQITMKRKIIILS